jgi:tetratricopeptide (TPR) repeat protein
MMAHQSRSYRYSRLLAWGSTVLLGVGALAWALGVADEVGTFLEPLVAAVLVCWAAHGVVYWWAGVERDKALLLPVQGPGEDLLHKAGLRLFRQQEEYELGSDAEADFLKGERNFLLNRYARAVDYYSACLEAAASLPAYLNSGAASLVVGDFDRAEEALDLGLRLSQRREERLFEAAFCANLGVLRGRRGAAVEAQELFRRSRELFGAAKNQAGHTAMELNLGVSYANRGSWERALPLFEAAAGRFRKLGSDLGHASALSNWGNALAEAGDEAGARRCYRLALGLHRGRDNTIGRANVLGNMGNLYLRGSEPEKALEHYRQALELHRQAGGPLGEAAVLGNMGNVHFRCGNYSEAATAYEAALDLHRRCGNRLGQARTLTNMGSLNARQGQWRRGIAALEEARAAYDELGTSGRAPKAVDKLLSRLKRNIEQDGDATG